MTQNVSSEQSAASIAPVPARPEALPQHGRRWLTADWVFRCLTLLFALSCMALIVGIALTLCRASLPNFAHTGARFLHTATWDPVAPDGEKRAGNIFGVLPFVYGTLLTSFLALLLAVPLSVGAAIFLAEIAPPWLNHPLSFIIEMLAAVPSIVYGFWGLLYLVPILQSRVEPWLSRHFGHIPLFAAAQDGGFGQDFFAAGLILALMVLPFITSVSRDVLLTVPNAQREAAYGMGATKWEVIKGIVLPYAGNGVIGAVMLGLGRAIGETMAVTLVIGSRPTLPSPGNLTTFSLFRPGYTMTSLLADQYPSPNSPLHTAALAEVALTLFVITIFINGLARGLVWLTAVKTSGSGSSESNLRWKRDTQNFLRVVVNIAVTAAFVFQIGADVMQKGARGWVGGAGLIGFLLLALALVNRCAPGTSLYPLYRRVRNGVSLGLCGLCTFVACAALAALFLYVLKQGLGSINPQFFRLPNPTDPAQGGMLHAIIGTVEFVGMASMLGVPVGILGGLFLSEFGNNRLGFCARFAADLLNGVPSIVIGIFAYTLIIVTTHSNFGLAGGFALGIMMIPTVMRTTEELVRLVPQSLREGSLALGATRAQTVWRVVLPSARSGIVTGVLLAIARVAGETAPLLMVGCDSSLWNINPQGQMASLPVQIYVLRDNPSELAQRQSWGVALVLVALVLLLNLAARLLTHHKTPAGLSVSIGVSGR